MDQNKNMIVGLVIVAAVVIAGVWWIKSKNPKTNLPDGKITTDMTGSTPSPLDLQKMLSVHPQVKISTVKGDFTIELRPDVAPQTVTNFLQKWNAGYCDGLTWHRVEDWVVQGCDPAGNGTGGQSILPTETSPENFGVGAVGVARKAQPKEISNDSQFFITKKDSSFLNGDYTYFGQVVSGMEVVNKLAVGDRILNTTILGK